MNIGKYSQSKSPFSREHRLDYAIVLKNLMSEIIEFLKDLKWYDFKDKRIYLNKIRRFQRIYLKSGCIDPSINEIFINMRRVINKQNNLFHTYRLKSLHIANKNYRKYLQSEIICLEMVKEERIKEFSKKINS